MTKVKCYVSVQVTYLLDNLFLTFKTCPGSKYNNTFLCLYRWSSRHFRVNLHFKPGLAFCLTAVFTRPWICNTELEFRVVVSLSQLEKWFSEKCHLLLGRAQLDFSNC